MSLDELQECINQQRWQDALRMVDVLCADEPGSRKWPMVRASIQIKAGAIQQGLQGLEQLVRACPDHYEAWLNLAQTCRALGDNRRALQAYESVLSGMPNQALALKGFGLCAMALGQQGRAVEAFGKLLAAGQADYEVCVGMAQCCLESSPDKAVMAASRACELQPGNSAAKALLARSHVNNESFTLAMGCFQGLLDDPAWRVPALKGVAACQLYLGQCDDAIESLASYRRAGGSLEEGLVMEGKARVQLGDKQAAINAYLLALEHKPDSVDAWYGLIVTDAAAVDETLFQKLIALYPLLSDARDKMLGAFAVARWYEASGNLPQQMHWLDLANQVRAELRPFNPDTLSQWRTICSSACDEAWFQRLGEANVTSHCPTPLLICGMPRSGTTLIEQILGRHSLVTPRGENHAQAQAISWLGDEKKNHQLDQFLAGIGPDDIEPFRKHYAQLLTENEAVSTPFFTSKSMDLVFNLGVLLAAVPELRVIHVRRHPLDVGLGCYKQYFAHGQGFAASWQGIARFYREFERLMDHWHALFPEKIITVAYEELVADQHAITRKMASHCGLPWEEQMLAFDQADTVVTTASALQVREGLFTSASGRWVRYGHHLDALKMALENNNVDWQAYSQSDC